MGQCLWLFQTTLGFFFVEFGNRHVHNQCHVYSFFFTLAHDFLTKFTYLLVFTFYMSFVHIQQLRNNLSRLLALTLITPFSFLSIFFLYVFSCLLLLILLSLFHFYYKFNFLFHLHNSPRVLPYQSKFKRFETTSSRIPSTSLPSSDKTITHPSCNDIQCFIGHLEKPFASLLYSLFRLIDDPPKPGFLQLLSFNLT